MTTDTQAEVAGLVERLRRRAGGDALEAGHAWRPAKKIDVATMDCWKAADLIERLTSPASDAIGDRERYARAMYEAWPNTVISQRLSELTGLPIGTVLTWDRAVETGADMSGLYRYADAILAATPQGVKSREAAMDLGIRRTMESGSGTDPKPSAGETNDG